MQTNDDFLFLPPSFRLESPQQLGFVKNHIVIIVLIGSAVKPASVPAALSLFLGSLCAAHNGNPVMVPYGIGRTHAPGSRHEMHPVKGDPCPLSLGG